MTTQTTSKVTINHNGFHGWHTLSFFAQPTEEINCGENNRYTADVSLRVGRRLNKAVCGSSDCWCGESIADCKSFNNYDGTGFARITYYSDDKGKTGTIRGNYPQQD
jgi:hypothetical protein